MKKIITLFCSIIALLSHAQQSSIVSSIPGLIVHIPFTSNATDVNGNYNANAAQIGIIPTISGNWIENYPVGTARRADRLLNSNAISLTGTNPINVNITIPANNFTLSFWVNTDDQTSFGVRRIFTATNGTDEVFYVNTNKVASPRSTSVGMRINHNTPVVLGFIENNQNFGSAVSIGWQYMTFTFSDTDDNIRLYTNGEFVQSYSTTISPAFATALQISTVGGYSGRLDEISIYNRALTSDEIKSLYNRCAPISAISKIEPTVPVGQGSKGVCASGSEAYAVTLNGAAMSGYWSAFSPLGGFTRTFSGLSVSISNLTTSGHTQIIRYIASNECVSAEEITFNSTQTASTAAPVPFISPLNTQNFTTILGCSSQGFRLNINGDNTVNSTFQLLKYNQEDAMFNNTQLTPVSNQYTISMVNTFAPDKTINTGTYLGIATNACGTGTTPGFVVQDVEVSYTGEFESYLPLETSPAANRKYFAQTITGLPANGLLVLDAGIIVSTTGYNFQWYKGGSLISNTIQEGSTVEPPFNPGGSGGPRPGGPIFIPGGRMENIQTATFAGANTSVLTISGFSNSDFATYQLQLTNPCSSITYYFDFVIKGNGDGNNPIVPGENTTTPGTELSTYTDIENDWTVYPNPTEGLITINAQSTYNVDITAHIFDLQGRVVKSFTVETAIFSIHTQLPKGMYLLQMKGEKKMLLIH